MKIKLKGKCCSFIRFSIVSGGINDVIKLKFPFRLYSIQIVVNLRGDNSERTKNNLMLTEYTSISPKATN